MDGWMDELMPRREVTCNATSGQIMRSQHAQGSCLSFLSFQVFNNSQLGSGYHKKKPQTRTSKEKRDRGRKEEIRKREEEGRKRLLYDQHINHLSANRRSKYLNTPMTLAASTSIVALELSRDSIGDLLGSGSV